MRHQDQLERLARRGTASVAGAAVSAVAGVALVAIITNGFSPALAGTLFAATSAFLVLEAVVLLGTDTGLVRWVPAHLASGRRQDVRATLSVALGPVLLAAVTAAVALFLLAPRLAPSIVGEAQAPAMTTFLRALAVLLPLAAAHDSLLAATRGLGTMRPTVVIENIGRLGLQPVAVAGVVLAGGGALPLVLGWGVPYVLAWVATTGWLAALLRRRTRHDGGSSRGVGEIAREFWWFTTPRAMARVTQTALKRIDIVLVAALASPSQAALYTAATRFVVLGQVLVQSVQRALAPHLSSLFARDDSAAARSIFQAATAWSMVLAWPIYLLCAAFAPTLLLLFGSGYAAAAEVVVILSLTMLVATWCGPVDSVLLMAGRSWLSLFNNTVALVVNLALNVLLIPPFGITGAAAAWSVAIVVRNLLPLSQVGRGLRMWPGTRASTYVAVSAVLCCGVAPAGAFYLGSLTAGTLVAVAGLCSYVGLLWMLRSPLQLRAFSAVVSRRARGRPTAAESPAR